MSAIIGNSVGVLMWGTLSAFGVSSLILASELAYGGLRIVGAVVLVVLGARSLLRRQDAELSDGRPKPQSGPAGDRAW